MAEVTPNLGLKKPLESEFVSIQTLNENMDKVDQSLGPVEDLPTTAKNAAGAISELYDQLADKPHEQLTLTPGVQIVQGGDVPAILRPTMQGRTLVNLLGRKGNFEKIADWAITSEAAVDTTNKLYGSQALRISGDNSGSLVASTTFEVPANSYFLAVVEALAGGQCQWKIGDANKVIGNGVNWLKFSSVSASTGTVQFYENGRPITVDGVRIYRISFEEFSKLESMTSDQILAIYPYVDDMKHINAVYIESKGKNLLPPFSEWQGGAGTISTINGAYEIMLGANQNIICEMNVLKNADYSVSFAAVGLNDVLIGVTDPTQNVAISGWKTSSFIFNTGGYSTIRVIISSGGSGAGRLSNIMMNIGSEALPFDPHKPSYLYLPDCSLRSNVDGNIADRLYTDGQGKLRVTRRFREMVLDGSLGWDFYADRTGFKNVTVPVLGAAGFNAQMIKYDGRYIPYADPTAETERFAFNTAATSIIAAISDAISGWGETYMPTADEIKAYFYGWRLYNNYTGLNFNLGEDPIHKRWTPVHRPWDGQGIASVVPTDFSSGYSPYRLMYQLAQSTEEQVTYEGSLMLHEGDNQVEVGTGIVVREAANPVYSGGTSYHINNPGTIPASNLKSRTKTIIGVYEDDRLDLGWKRRTDNPGVFTFGVVSLYKEKEYYKPGAAYSVTYLVLDTYALGITPQTIGAEYAPNIRESVESLVREVVEARTETSVLQNTKENTQKVTLAPKWINATLLADWSGNFDYAKDENGLVTLRYGITAGTTTLNTPIMFLPAGYFPATNTPIPTSNNNSGSAGLGLYINGTIGGVAVTETINFTAGQLIYGSITYKALS